MGKICIFAGANGSGKSSVIKSLKLSGEYDGYTYICPDAFVDRTKKDVVSEYKYWMDKCAEMRKIHAQRGKPFIVETVLSDSRKIEEFKEYKKLYNAEIEVIYIITGTPKINIERVQKRVSEGGHDVPIDKIVSRWGKSIGNLIEINKIADKITIYDNSKKTPIVVYQRDKDAKKHLDLETWLIQYLS